MTSHAAAAQSPTAPEPPHAERVRTLLVSERVGALATQSERHPGWPFASVMPYALTADGAPLFLISGMAIHTQNLVADPRASLLVTQSGAEHDPLGSARVTIMGNARRIEDPPAAIRDAYLARHPSSKYWIEFSDFSFFQLEVTAIYFVGGFGVMGWVEAGDYRNAAPDPLVDSASEIVRHMNDDHADALRSITRHFGGLEAEEAKMVSCDRLGFVVRARTAGGMKGVRIAFPEPVASSDDVRRLLIAMTRASRDTG